MAEGTEKIENRLKSMDSDLKARNQKAETILWGVAHVFKPPKELLEDIRRADIVTLELPPGAITHRKKETDKDMLAFWDGVLGELGEADKKFWAVDTNKPVRNMRKAILRRLKSPTTSFFPDDMETVSALAKALTDAASAPGIVRTVQEDLLAFVMPPENMKTLDIQDKTIEIKRPIVIVRPFHGSIKELCKYAEKRLGDRFRAEGFGERLILQLGLDYVFMLILAYEDKTQADNMLHRLKNFCKTAQKDRALHVHVGGYWHNSNLYGLLKSADCGNYSVKEKGDPRFPLEEIARAKAFEKIPLETRIKLVRIEKNEVTVDAGKAKEVFDRLTGDYDMNKLVNYFKIDAHNGYYSKKRGCSRYCSIFRKRLISHLSLNTPTERLEEIQKRCAIGKDPIEVFLAYLKEKGFKPDAETLQYIKKGRENRCI